MSPNKHKSKFNFYNYLIYTLYLILLSNFIIKSNAELSKFYGVPEEKKKLYMPKEGNFFQCLDGSKIIQYSAVNDDYCDCPDGSDEPGTSACKNTMFNCKNEGHISVNIPSNKVNDGVCDPECCDGSDEYSGIIKCPNICNDIAKKYIEETMKKQKILKEGYSIKQKYLKEAAELTAKEKKRATKLESEIEVLEKKINKLEEIKTIASEMDKRVQNVIEEEKNKIIIKKCPKLLEDCNKNYNSVHTELKYANEKNQIYEETLEEIFNLVMNMKQKIDETTENHDDTENSIDINSIHQQIKEDIDRITEEIQINNEKVKTIKDNKDHVKIDDDSDDEDEDAEAEKIRFKLDLTIDHAKVESDLKLSPCEDLTKTDLNCALSGIKSLYYSTINDVKNDFHSFTEWKGWSKFKYSMKQEIKSVQILSKQFIKKLKSLKKENEDSTPNKEDENGNEENKVNESEDINSKDATVKEDLEFDENINELKNNYAGVNALMNKLNQQLSKKTKKLEEINTDNTLDFGANQVFRTLKNKCFDIEASGYIYTLCLFKDAKQKPKNENVSTSLGKWSHFDGPNKMVFNKGEKCWNGPERSAKITLECSNVNELISVSEPSKCEYLMIFKTPAVCNEYKDNTTAENAKDEL